MNQACQCVKRLRRSLGKFYRTQKHYGNARRCLSTSEKSAVILGIETSCDETGFAIVDSTGKVLGEALNSQLVHHLQVGGINPPTAQRLHLENIDNVYNECLKSANMTIDDVDAIAVTLSPGLAMSLCVGKNFALNLSKTSKKPLIPIHHMQAHALTARMIEKVEFPFLVLLISGGHCLLSLAQAIDKFKILGQTIDDAPGEAFDKIARRLKLINIPEYSKISGGQAIELAAKKADDPLQFDFPTILSHYRDCNFSFSGIKTKATRHIIKEEEKYFLEGNEIIPSVNNLAAGFLLTISKHLCLRTERAMEFLWKQELIPEDKKTLVVSGGVASNNFIANALKKICSEHGYRLVRPPPKLCTDNGIMIAWNGVEKYVTNCNILKDVKEIEGIDIATKAPIGDDWSQRVTDEGIRRKWTKLKFEEFIQR